jgi:hypothetical protein
MNHLTPSHRNYIRVISNFFLKFAEIFASEGAPPVSTTPAANLPPMSTTPVVHLELRISPRICEKIRNGPNGILRGLGETDSEKTEVENLVALSLSMYSVYRIRVLLHQEGMKSELYSMWRKSTSSSDQKCASSFRESITHVQDFVV